MKRAISLSRRLAVVALVALTPASLAATASTAATKVYKIPASIAADCSKDVTDSLNSFIAGVPDGSVVEFPAGSCYRLDGTLKIYNRWNLTFEGNGATLRAFTAGDQSRHHVVLYRGGGITMRDLTVVGANPNAGMSQEAWDSSHIQHGFKLSGVEGAVLDGVQVYDVYGDFVYVGAGDNVPSRNVQILDSAFDRNGRQGIAVASGEHVLIQGNTVANVRMSAIDLEPMAERWRVLDVQVIDNTLGPWRPGYTLLSAASRGPVNDVSLIDNTVNGSLRIIVQSKSSGWKYGGFLISGNTASEEWAGTWSPMKFTRTDDIELGENEQSFRRRAAFVNLVDSDGVTIHDNDIQGASAAYIKDADSTDVEESNNDM